MAVVNIHIEVLIFTAYAWGLYNVVLPAAAVLTLLHRDGVLGVLRIEPFWSFSEHKVSRAHTRRRIVLSLS